MRILLGQLAAHMLCPILQWLENLLDGCRHSVPYKMIPHPRINLLTKATPADTQWFHFMVSIHLCQNSSS